MCINGNSIQPRNAHTLMITAESAGSQPRVTGGAGPESHRKRTPLSLASWSPIRSSSQAAAHLSPLS